MGRQNVIVLGLIFMALLGLAAAASSPSASPSKAPTASTEVEAPVTDDEIGTTDDIDAAASPGDDVAVAGPLGSDSSYASYGPSSSEEPADHSGAAALGVSAVVIGATSIVGSFLFF